MAIPFICSAWDFNPRSVEECGNCLRFCYLGSSDQADIQSV